MIATVCELDEETEKFLMSAADRGTSQHHRPQWKDSAL